MAMEIRPVTLAAGSTIIRAAPGKVGGYWFKNVGGTPITVTIFDNTTAAGTKILVVLTVAATTGDTTLIEFPFPIQFTVGISVLTSGGTLQTGFVLAD